MKIHDEYLKFFNIAQKKDEMAKIEKVSRYVGLGLPKLKKFWFVWFDRTLSIWRLQGCCVCNI